MEATSELQPFKSDLLLFLNAQKGPHTQESGNLNSSSKFTSKTLYDFNSCLMSSWALVPPSKIWE